MNSVLSKITIFHILFISLFINTIETVSADENVLLSGIENIQEQILSSEEQHLVSIQTLHEDTSIVSEVSLEQHTETVSEIQEDSQELLLSQQTSSQEDVSQTINIPEQTFFVVTAYYSPLPWQNYYLRGNYEDEVILNGRWVRGASGKEVFPWMLAAPKNYNFWTKIYLEWIGIWEVADRGGAIVPAWERWYNYDRIDIWMGHWEEWLKRALAWWKKVVPWYVLSDNTESVSVNIQNFAAPESALRNLTKAVNIHIPEEINAFTHYITPQSSGESVRKLQRLMYTLWITKTLYTSGKYWDIQEDLIRYQIEKWIIARREDYGAWYFGLQTNKKMKEDYLADYDNNTINQQIKSIVTKAQQNANAIMKHIWDPKLWQSWNNIKTLQQLLRSLGASNAPANGIFGAKMERSLITYQIEKGIIKDAKTSWAGMFWPKTKEQFKKDLIIMIEKHLFKQQNLMSYYKK